MGVSVSKSRQNIKELNEQNLAVSNKQLSDIKNTCSSKQVQSNVLNIIGSDVTKLSTDQSNVAKNMCMLSTAIQMNIDSNNEAKMATALKSQIESNAVAGVGVSASESDANIERTNKVNINVSNETINRAVMGCINDQTQSNVINIIGSRVTDSNLKQANEALVECISNYGGEQIISQSAEADTKSDMDTTVKSKAEGYDVIGKIGGLFSTYIWGVVVVCVASIIASAVSSMGGAFMGGGGGGDGGGSDNSAAMATAMQFASRFPRAGY